MTPTLHLEHDYLLISGTDLEQMRGGEAFWAKLSTDAEHLDHVGTGWLIAAFPTTADWATWEMHPRADEVVHITSGRLVVIFDRGGSHERISAGTGDTVIVPAGMWHTMDVVEPGATLNITHGPGTEHRPR
jgi:mannose-6-phosphate isomerase-like protein (cupin superfamily)